MALTNNTTTGERPEARTIRAGIAAQQAAKVAENARIAATSKVGASGTQFGSTVEPQPVLQRPVVTHGG